MCDSSFPMGAWGIKLATALAMKSCNQVQETAVLMGQFWIIEHEVSAQKSADYRIIKATDVGWALLGIRIDFGEFIMVHFSQS